MQSRGKREPMRALLKLAALHDPSVLVAAQLINLFVERPACRAERLQERRSTAR
jgi:hypothetical protein